MRIRKKPIFIVLMMLLICITAMPISASAAKLSKKSATIYTGKILKLKVSGTSKKIVWSSSKPSIAKVDQNGKIKAVKKGSAVIKAKVGKKIYKCKVTVKQRATSVSLNKSSYFMIPGKTWTPQVTVKPSNADDKRIQWSSSDKSIAKVDSKGKITAVANGKVVITAMVKDGSKKKASCIIYVLKGGSTTENKDQTAVKPGSVKVPSQTTQSALARKFLALLEKYSQQVQSDKTNGTAQWFYSNGGTESTWRGAVSRRKNTGSSSCNCALLVRWGLRELGIINAKNFWGEKGGEIHYSGDVKKQLLKHCKIIKVYKTPNQLLAEGNLLPGDICTWVEYRHTNVYAGNGLWYDAGRMGNLGEYVNERFVFQTFGPAATINMSDATVGHIIRLVK